MSEDKAQLEAELERLRREMAQLQAKLEGTGSIAQGEGASAVTATATGEGWSGRSVGPIRIPVSQPPSAPCVERR